MQSNQLVFAGPTHIGVTSTIFLLGARSDPADMRQTCYKSVAKQCLGHSVANGASVQTFARSNSGDRELVLQGLVNQASLVILAIRIIILSNCNLYIWQCPFNY